MAKLLLLEDDLDLAAHLYSALKSEGFEVEVVNDGEEARDLLRLYQYDLAILDWDVPKLSGLEVLQSYRSVGGKMPVIFLTGKALLPDKRDGFESGADDYLTKPFEFVELLWRIRANLRRPLSYAPEEIVVGAIVFDRANRTVKIGGNEVRLLPLEHALLELFITHPGETFSAEAILNSVWRSDSEATIYTLRTYIKTLRQKIEPDGKRLIHNIYGVGYRFEPGK